MNGLGKHKEREILILVMGLLMEFHLVWLEVPSAVRGSQWCSNTAHIIAIPGQWGCCHRAVVTFQP